MRIYFEEKLLALQTIDVVSFFTYIVSHHAPENIVINVAFTEQSDHESMVLTTIVFANGITGTRYTYTNHRAKNGSCSNQQMKTNYMYDLKEIKDFQ